MVVKQMIEPDLDPLFLPDPTVTGRESRLWTPSEQRVSGAGSMIGSSNSTSKGCLTIFHMIFC